MVYCVYKIVKCTVNIIFSLDPKKDPITRGFELGLKVLSVEDPEVWVQPASFILVGCLVFASVRGFLKQFIKVRGHGRLRVAMPNTFVVATHRSLSLSLSNWR